MPNRKANTPGTDKVRERVVKVMKQIIARDLVEDKQSFALRIGAVPYRITAWQDGTGYPTLENIVDLCREFGVSEGYIISGRGEMFREDAVTLAGLEKRVQALERKK